MKDTGSIGVDHGWGIEMSRYALILGGLILLCTINRAGAEATTRVRFRQLTDAENKSLDELLFPSPQTCVKWAVAIIAKEVPINYPGLPKIEAFEQTTLAFDPGPDNNPDEATVVFTWPAGTIDASTGEPRRPLRIAGMRYRTLTCGNSVWLFNIDEVIDELRQGALQFHIEMQPRGQPRFDLKPGCFRDGTAWAYFDPRIGTEEFITVAMRQDGSCAMVVRGGTPAAAAPVQTRTQAAQPTASTTSSGCACGAPSRK